MFFIPLWNFEITVILYLPRRKNIALDPAYITDIFYRNSRLLTNSSLFTWQTPIVIKFLFTNHNKLHDFVMRWLLDTKTGQIRSLLSGTFFRYRIQRYCVFI